MKVPFLDLSIQTAQIRDDINVSIQEVIDKSAFSLGFAVEKFETEFAAYLNAKFVLGVNSGTSALHLALIAAGVSAGDEVITVSHTFIATAWAISYAGATPVFVDIENDHYTMDSTQIESKITSKTKAIICVHLYGQSADLDAIKAIADKNNLALIEDAAQAQGTTYKGKSIGSHGLATCFSFYPGKNLGAFGEAGAVATNDPKIAERIKKLRNHSQPEKYIHEELGFNYRMEGLQGAVLSVKLKKLDQWNQQRIEIAAIYNERLGNHPKLKVPKVRDKSKHIYHLYELGFESKEQRDNCSSFLTANEIQNGLHYPIPVHLQKAYSHLGYKKGDFPNTEAAADRLLSLPIFPGMAKEQSEFVCEKILEFANIL